jgi:hypothetical protein
VQLTCPVCGTEFEYEPRPGRPPVTCGKEDCRRSRKTRKTEESRRRAVARGCPDDLHGTATGYSWYKCGCAKCNEWSRLDMQERRAKRKASQHDSQKRRTPR